MLKINYFNKNYEEGYEHLIKLNNQFNQLILFSGQTEPFGVSGGIMIGIVAALCYHRFKSIRLPESLQFFGGPRFVPIAMGLVTAMEAVNSGHLRTTLSRTGSGMVWLCANIGAWSSGSQAGLSVSAHAQYGAASAIPSIDVAEPVFHHGRHVVRDYRQFVLLFCRHRRAPGGSDLFRSRSGGTHKRLLLGHECHRY